MQREVFMKRIDLEETIEGKNIKYQFHISDFMLGIKILAEINRKETVIGYKYYNISTFVKDLMNTFKGAIGFSELYSYLINI